MHPDLRQSTGSPTHDPWADWLRGIAALLVLLTHGRQGFFVDWDALDPASQTPLNQLLFFITQLGREAVVIFFVLSGWLVGGQSLAAYRAGAWSLGGYFISRISRLHVVIVPALLLTAVIDYFNGTWTREDHGLSSFLVNLFSLQGLFGQAYGSNGPLWSLAYEWWFYVLWGFVLAALASPGPRRVASLLVIVATTGLLAWRCPGILEMFALWLFGVVARNLPPSRWSPSLVATLAAVGLCIAMAISTSHGTWWSDALVAVATAGVLGACRGLQSPSAVLSSLGKSLAAFSFSLYALHYPLNEWMIDAFAPRRSTDADVASWSAWLLLMAAQAFLCWCFYWLFERHTPAVRAALSDLRASLLRARIRAEQ